jgi:hypothetical protein
MLTKQQATGNIMCPMSLTPHHSDFLAADFETKPAGSKTKTGAADRALSVFLALP